MKITVALLIHALTKFVIALSFMVVIFAAIGVPVKPHTHGIIDFLVSSADARLFAAVVMTGIFGWLFCLDAKPFWNRFAILRGVDKKAASH